MAIYSLRDILFTIKELLSLADRRDAKNQKTVDALISIQTAIIETRKFINESGYVANTDLSKLWLSTFDNVKKAEIYPKNEFPEYLYQKARFWGDPKVWLKEPAAMELVPTLAELEKQADSILVRLK
jgi:hypothetical protein